MINASPKGHYVKKRPARRATTLKSDRTEGPLRLKRTRWKAHYAQKGLSDDNYRPEGPLHSRGTSQKSHYVRKGPARKAIILTKGY
jgi:hypothetical protein